VDTPATENKDTGRQWRADRYDSRNYDGSTREGYVIHDGADVVASMIKSRANALLLAAAPELLEAMKWFCQRVDNGEVRSLRTYARFKELINKAEGRQ